MKYAPLHIVSCYTFLSSGLTMDRIAQSVKQNDYFGAAVTDLNVAYGIPEFINKMDKIGKKYIVGTELEFEGDYISIFVLDETGYKNYTNLISIKQKQNLTYDDLKNYSSGLLTVLDTSTGVFKEKLNNIINIDNEFTLYLNRICKIFKYFYLGLNITSREEIPFYKKLRAFSKEYGYELVAFPRILYQNKDDAIVLDIVEAIKNKTTLVDKVKSGQSYFMDETTISKIYSKKEIENTINIINLSSFNFHQKRGELFRYPVENANEYLKTLTFNSLKEKGLEDNIKYVNRLNYELEVIISMGFSDYFLIVYDYINYAKTHDILVGPGRGSSAGSLVSYLLNITTIDPLKYDLQFERFLNPARKSMPDIDVDFMNIKREDMVEYMRQRYGKNKVATIITFQALLAKQSIDDAGKVYNYNQFYISSLSKTITDSSLSLSDCYKKLPAFRKLVDSDKYYLDLVKLASKIEGMPRQRGKGAAGVMLSNVDINNVMPIVYDEEGNLLTQFEKDFLEEQGFLKMDFLPLNNLTIIYDCVKMINSNHSINLNPYNIPYDTKETYDLIASGKTMGIFQLESSGMKNAIKLLKPNCFNDIVALLALFRPATLQDVQTYSDRKYNRSKCEYYSKDLEKVLGPTYGVIVYQEQVNTLAQVMAGLSPSEADSFRRAISKKDNKAFVELENKFIQGSIKKGYTPKQAKDIYNRMILFSGYGLNKSHSVAYAMIACETAYLKAKYPLEFYTTILQSGKDSKLVEYVSEMNNRNIKVLLPDINISDVTFSIYNDSIIYPIGEINNINKDLTYEIIEERNLNGKFKDFFDFVIRMYPRKLNEKSLIALIKSGAFDSFTNRASLLASSSRAIQFAELNLNKDGQLILNENLLAKPSLLIEEDDPIKKLNDEYDALNIMLSANPLTYKRDYLNEHGVISLIEAKEGRNACTIAGIIKDKKIINTKKGSPMAFVKIYDETGEYEITVFPDLFTNILNILEKNNIIMVKGYNKSKNGEISFIANDISLVE